MEAGDGGEEEGLNDGEVEENMIVVGSLLLSTIRTADQVGIESSRRW